MKGEDSSRRREGQVANEPWGLRSRERKESGWKERRKMRAAGGAEVKGKAGARFYYLEGQGEEFGLYPSVTTSNGRLRRVEM